VAWKQFVTDLLHEYWGIMDKADGFAWTCPTLINWRVANCMELDRHTHFQMFFLFQCINNKSKLTRTEFTTWVWFQFCIVSTQYWPYMMYVVVSWIDLIPDILRSKVHSMGATHRFEGNPFS
jgi:hypothetical protein